MRRALWALIAVAVIGGVAFLLVRGSGISAVEHRPFPLEARLAKSAWRTLVPSSVRRATNPVAATPEVLREARDHFADHCAICHDNDGSGDTVIGRRVYPPAPDLRAERTQQLTDGELFYSIEQGIPWTAMPGFRSSPEGEHQSWALVRFIRYLPKLTAD